MQSLPTVQDQDQDQDRLPNDNEAAILASSILIVDDQAAHVLLLERLLHDAGYTNVTSTMEPREVGALQRKNRYDLILLDIQMPGLDGFAVMAGLRADLVSNCLPVIVLTAQPGHKLRALQAGARDFINKPFENVEVKVRIHHMLEVRLLHKHLQAHNRDLERTAELRESEARYRSLTQLAVDWYWEQNEAGQLTQASGLVMELLGITHVAHAAHEALAGGSADSVGSAASAGSAGHAAHLAEHGNEGQDLSDAEQGIDHWDPAERQTLEDNIKARRPFLDLVMHRRRTDGSRQQFRISGEPMFDGACRFTGYRGLGVEVLSNQ